METLRSNARSVTVRSNARSVTAPSIAQSDHTPTESLRFDKTISLPYPIIVENFLDVLLELLLRSLHH